MSSKTEIYISPDFCIDKFPVNEFLIRSPREEKYCIEISKLSLLRGLRGDPKYEEFITKLKELCEGFGGLNYAMLRKSALDAIGMYRKIVDFLLGY